MSWYIETRAEFFEVLNATIAKAEAKAAAVPAFWLYQNVVAQLLAMREWTANGRVPAREERDRIDIGLIALREVDEQADAESADFQECLVQLDGYFCEWPDDEPAADHSGSHG